MDKNEIEKIESEIRKGLIGDIEEYVKFYLDEIVLDGSFTSEQLRHIADAYDEFKKRLKELGIK